MSSYTQIFRNFAVESPLGPDVLLFYSMTGREYVSQLFEYDLEVLSTNDHIRYDDILGNSVTVRMELPAGGKRYFNARVCQFSQFGWHGRLARYRAILRPWLWFLTRCSDCRIFQNQTAPDIVKQVLRDHGFTDIEDKLTSSYRQREYCVQYRETDFNFISRLLEEEGIYYFFKHEPGKHTLVLADSLGAHSAAPGFERIRYVPPEREHIDLHEHIYEWEVRREVQSGVYNLNDFDFKKPKADLNCTSSRPRSHVNSDYEHFDYPGLYTETSDGDKYTLYRVEDLQSQFERMSGNSYCSGMRPGALFNLVEHPRGDQNNNYLVLGTNLRLLSDEYITSQGAAAAEECKCSFLVMDSRQRYCPPRITRKPLIHGAQTAIVVGKQGEEIWTDEYGRIKVLFHWDRAHKDQRDENCSCWVRVAQPVAGSTWGWINIPRIDQEVVVSFLEGDPDQPLVTGRVYNADQMPPYELPANKTQSGFKSRSSKQGAAANFNEFRFEDKKGEEEVYLHAEKNYNTVVENDATVKIGFDKKEPGNLTADIYNHRTTSLEMGNDTLTIKKGNQDTKVELGSSTLEAMQSITLKVGQNSVVIDQAGITVKGLMITIEGSVKLDAKSPMTTVQGSGILTLQGGLIKIN